MNYNILALDPALSTTGFAVLASENEKIIEAGKYVTSPKKTDLERMREIAAYVVRMTKWYSIKHVVLEDGFVNRLNVKTGLQLATLRGFIMGALSSVDVGIYYSLPAEIRKELGIGGNADKEKVAAVITEMYKDDEVFQKIGPYSNKQNKNKTSDIYDAISIGVAFLHRCKREIT